ncbi:MAG TPA: regulatory protein RecX [Gemmatimonadota bacterium]|nr:regulatory protein RecX [Gemmatimonadota bacterium]
MKRSEREPDPAARERVRKRALGLLARREHTVRELGEKLTSRGEAGEEVVRAVVEELARKDLVSDARYARAYALDAIRMKPRARRRIVSELVDRGVPAANAAQAVDAAFAGEEVDDTALARRLAEAYLPRVADQDDETRWRRVATYLQRRGFDNALIYDVCREILPEPGT